MKTHIICSQCGSTDVYADATARWNVLKGEWVLGTVHDDRYCDNCGAEADLIEVDEAEGLEIQVSGMIADGENSFRLVEDHEEPAFFDVMVRTTALESGDILTLHEFDDLTRPEADKVLNDLLFIFRTTPISRFLGKRS
ncbi:MAG: hypothetical protein COB08_005105 [Rhodobacteraceae bacterium]|nr:hypothetical protein [Paracoccaceae bacterium]